MIKLNRATVKVRKTTGIRIGPLNIEWYELWTQNYALPEITWRDQKIELLDLVFLADEQAHRLTRGRCYNTRICQALSYAEARRELTRRRRAKAS